METCSLANTPCPGHASGFAGVLFAQLVQTLLVAQCGISNPTQYPDDFGNQLRDGDTYDFIVVGAGSAGSVLANRLSEVEKWRILLVEAGGNPSMTSDVPSLFLNMQGSEMDWGYDAEGDNICQSMVGKKCKWPRGKGLGGSSSINANFYIRGNKGDYDNWEKNGNPGWSYDDVLPYFKKSEDMVDETLHSDHVFHGKDGPLTVGKFGFKHPLKDIIFAAGEEMGYKHLHDLNGKENSGYGECHGTVRDGKRCSTAKAFLAPAKERKNLHVSKNSLVTRVIIDKDTKKTMGIELKRDGKTITVKADKEVILSAGAINSPQILMLSGIGPKKHLKDMGVEHIVDLPVGKYLQDHFIFPIYLQLQKFTSPPVAPLEIVDELYTYLTTSTGIFSTVMLSDTMGFIKTQSSLEFPDIQLLHGHFMVNDTYFRDTYSTALKLDESTTSNIVAMNSKYDVIMVVPILLRPKSVGRVLLRSKDPERSPLIKAGYLTEKEDTETMLRSIRYVEKMADTKALRSIGAKLYPIEIEGCKEHELGSDAYWICALRHVGSTLYHPTSTCKMGPATDKGAVVDSELAVHGIKNLRVVDASIMPDIVSGNTNAPTIMIGEKAADIIKKAWMEYFIDLNTKQGRSYKKSEL